tara:strand:+ start:160 stop:441 length:282 start_codon:yes stop_codon:yes gene_type:complete
MLVIFKNEEGAYSVRPAFIGFIKNDIVRRTLGVIFYPFVIIATILINIIQAAFFSVIMLIRAIYHPLVNIRSYRKSELWKRPRTKADKNSEMD